MRVEESLIRPQPFKHFASKRVVYVPVDTPGGVILKHIEKKAEKIKISEWGTLARLEDKVVLYCAMGAPLAVMTLERLIASGAGEILVLGFCGSLDPRLKIGAAVDITRAFADEGTSRHYISRRRWFRPSRDFSSEIEGRLAAEGLSLARTTAVSTDAPFRETKGWLGAMVRRGCGVVDMEASAVYDLAEYHGRLAAALMIVSDELSRGKWKHGFFDSGLEETVERYFMPFI